MITLPINELEICSKYINGFTISRLSLEYGISKLKIKKTLLENNISLRLAGSWTRKYSVNENFFKKIDTEEKAYWLGFLYADGCIAEHSVNLQLSQEDVEILERFKKDLQYTGIIELRSDAVNYGKKYGIKIQKTAKIRIHNLCLRQDLINLGCVPRKTFILTFPSQEKLPLFLRKHFIRGYFDGDGSIWDYHYETRGRKIHGVGAQITSTFSFLETIKTEFEKEFHCKLKIWDHKSKGIGILRINDRNVLFKLRKYFYENSTVFLKRKMDKFYSAPIFEILHVEKKIKSLIKEEIGLNENFTSRSLFDKWKIYPIYSIQNAIKDLKKQNLIKIVGNEKHKGSAEIYMLT